jgi:hypothetical protein
MSSTSSSKKSFSHVTADLPRFDCYTVIGLSGGERLSEVYETETAAQAERLFSGELVAGVLGGAQDVDPALVLDDEAEWVVIGYYRDNEQRYATSVQARSATEAEGAAILACNEDNGYPDKEWALDYDEEIIVVCGVVLGGHSCQDVYASDEGAIWTRPSDEDVAYERARRGL